MEYKPGQYYRDKDTGRPIWLAGLSYPLQDGRRTLWVLQDRVDEELKKSPHFIKGKPALQGFDPQLVEVVFYEPNTDKLEAWIGSLPWENLEKQHTHYVTGS